MSDQTDEMAFEQRVEEILVEQSGWKRGEVVEWDRARAFFPARIITFLKESQMPLWQQMEAQRKANNWSLVTRRGVTHLAIRASVYVSRMSETGDVHASTFKY